MIERIALIGVVVVREAVRRRLLLAVAFLTIAIVPLSGWGFHKLATIRDAGGHALPPAELATTVAILVLMMAFMFSVTLALGAAFLAAPSLAGDIESGLLLAILPRRLRRAEVVLGKWSGTVALLTAYVFLIGGIEFAVVKYTTGYLPPHPGWALTYLLAESVVLLSFGLLLSSRLAPVTSGIIALVLFGFAWIGGITQSIGLALGNQPVTNGGTIMSLILPTDGLWRGAIYHLEPVAMVSAAANAPMRGGPFAVTGPPSSAYLVWSACWVAAVLALAVWSFARRDL